MDISCPPALGRLSPIVPLLVQVRRNSGTMRLLRPTQKSPQVLRSTARAELPSPRLDLDSVSRLTFASDAKVTMSAVLTAPANLRRALSWALPAPLLRPRQKSCAPAGGMA